MALLDGKTAEQIAAEIIRAAKENVKIEISGVAAQNLDSLLNYKHAKQIYSKGIKWFEMNKEYLRQEFLEGVIAAQYEQRKKADAATAEKDKTEYVKLLVSRGVNRFVALEMAGLISKADVEAAQKLEAEAKAKAEKEKAEADAKAKAEAEKAAAEANALAEATTAKKSTK